MKITLIYINMHDKEKRIRDHRLTEATRKNLVGLEGKFGTILKSLGKPIIGDGGIKMFESTPMPNFYDYLDEEEGLETMEEDQPTTDIGVIFDGLTSGLHLEIIYKYEERELKVLWQGEMVYLELAGELECYIPSHTWESKIDYLFNVAKKRVEKERRKIVDEDKLEKQRDKLSFLARLRKMWGNS